MKNKEKLVRNLVNTFNDRDGLHRAYKEKMAEILRRFAESLVFESVNGRDENFDMDEFIYKFVEVNFKPRD